MAEVVWDPVPEDEVTIMTEVEGDSIVVTVVLEGSVLVKVEGIKVVVDVKPDVSDEVRMLEIELDGGRELSEQLV